MCNVSLWRGTQYQFSRYCGLGRAPGLKPNSTRVGRVGCLPAPETRLGMALSMSATTINPSDSRYLHIAWPGYWLTGRRCQRARSSAMGAMSETAVIPSISMPEPTRPIRMTWFELAAAPKATRVRLVASPASITQRLNTTKPRKTSAF